LAFSDDLAEMVQINRDLKAELAKFHYFQALKAANMEA